MLPEPCTGGIRSCKVWQATAACCAPIPTPMHTSAPMRTFLHTFARMQTSMHTPEHTPVHSCMHPHTRVCTPIPVAKPYALMHVHVHTPLHSCTTPAAMHPVAACSPAAWQCPGRSPRAGLLLLALHGAAGDGGSRLLAGAAETPSSLACGETAVSRSWQCDGEKKNGDTPTLQHPRLLGSPQAAASAPSCPNPHPSLGATGRGGGRDVARAASPTLTFHGLCSILLHVGRAAGPAGAAGEEFAWQYLAQGISLESSSTKELYGGQESTQPTVPEPAATWKSGNAALPFPSAVS